MSLMPQETKHQDQLEADLSFLEKVTSKPCTTQVPHDRKSERMNPRHAYRMLGQNLIIAGSSFQGAGLHRHLASLVPGLLQAHL